MGPSGEVTLNDHVSDSADGKRHGVAPFARLSSTDQALRRALERRTHAPSTDDGCVVTVVIDTSSALQND